MFNLRFSRVAFLFLSFIALHLSTLEVAFSSSTQEKPDIIVARDGSGNFTTIQAALDAIPAGNAKPLLIFIKKGIYREKLFITKSFVTLLGEDRDSTRIIYPELRKNWVAAHNGNDWGSATVNIDSAASDITLANLTIYNNYGSLYGNHDHQFAIRGFGTRVIILGCNIIADGGDTLSLWDRADGMYYHAECYFEGWVDYVCPRGWCYITDSRFFGHNRPSASLWHDGSYDRKQKFVIANAFIDGVSEFPLGRNHLDGQIYLLNCTFAANMADRPFYRPPSSPREWRWGARHYFSNCHRIGGDYAWFRDNLETAESSPKPADITARWTFDGRWDPEATMPSLLPRAILPEPGNRSGDVDGKDVMLRWLPARNASHQLVFLGKDGNAVMKGFSNGRTFDAGPLEPRSTYHWRVDVVTGTDTVRGTMWAFSTK